MVPLETLTPSISYHFHALLEVGEPPLAAPGGDDLSVSLCNLQVSGEERSDSIAPVTLTTSGDVSSGRAAARKWEQEAGSCVMRVESSMPEPRAEHVRPDRSVVSRRIRLRIRPRVPKGKIDHSDVGF